MAELFWALSDISFEVNQGDIPADVERITNHRSRINRLAIYDGNTVSRFLNCTLDNRFA
ncbi:MAG: hypothetical protein R3C56_03595 [Pirellulaceae bacterium]